LSFPEDPGEAAEFRNRDEAAEFRNREEDNLPQELKGISFWTIKQDFTQSSYTILGPGGVWVPVEYINNQWYYTYWDTKEKAFWTTKEDVGFTAGLGCPCMPDVVPALPPHDPVGSTWTLVMSWILYIY
jgi:hypothetical protein